jgi:PLP dependent protein
MDIKRNIELIREEVSGYGARLIAVSKTQPTEKILEAYQSGQRLFGENKVQELLAKQKELPTDIEWHLIGHLQTNKVKSVVPFVSMIHAVDSEKLAGEINKQAMSARRVVRCLLQVHIAKEETKFGFDRDELLRFIGQPKLASYKHISITGLMGMATFTENKEQIRQEFRGLKQLFDHVRSLKVPGVEMTELSMGMSSDYQIALEEGSTLVRIGTSIFGERNVIKNQQA